MIKIELNFLLGLSVSAPRQSKNLKSKRSFVVISY